MQRVYLKTDKWFLLRLPSEIVINILSRLPVRTILSCKCVCKQLLNLLSTPDYAASHLPLSTPGLVNWYEHKLMPNIWAWRWIRASTPQSSLQSRDGSDSNLWINGLVNGLICLQDLPSKLYDALYVHMQSDHTRVYCSSWDWRHSWISWPLLSMDLDKARLVANTRWLGMSIGIRTITKQGHVRVFKTMSVWLHSRNKVVEKHWTRPNVWTLTPFL